MALLYNFIDWIALFIGYTTMIASGMVTVIWVMVSGCGIVAKYMKTLDMFYRFANSEYKKK